MPLELEMDKGPMDSVSGFLPPPYGTRTLAEVVPSLLAALGAQEFDNPLGVTAPRSVCLTTRDLDMLGHRYGPGSRRCKTAWP